MLLHSNILGEGAPFIILHGFLGTSDNWKTMGTEFRDKGFQVHLIDQRNHGQSFWDDTFNYEVLADDLKHYCEHYQLDNIVLLGHSMGGKTAMLFATLYPELVSKLIVADISPRFYPEHHQTILEGLQSIDFEEVKSRGVADKILGNYITDFGTRQFLLKNLYWKQKGELAFRMNLKVLVKNISEIGQALSNDALFNSDALFLRGDKSDYIQKQDENLILHHFPKSQIVSIKNAGHWLHAENPKDFFEAVMRFLS
ncbi:alpha/beta hydrolase [Pseudalgibacter alginicilyticus]|uniref:Alpha/beta hydrolase n=1 Tax=Pseudalgibacter alginicilyticus TaxID=1736674 RepID=A0A0P0D9M4_9FLAO|nr:alpha/beta fold hydrolase [Pseudalgibacter alginicilyticus]ALJ06848.1 alpha/beta hydrolase [Pseudalgibacter alginicilyticus]